MKTLKYISILVVLTCSATAYGGSKSSFSISISLQPARQPVYIYRSVPVFRQPVVYYTRPQPVYTCQQPVYVNRVSVYEQPGFSVSFSTSWGGGGYSYYGDHRSHRDGRRDGGRRGGRGHR